MLRMCMILIFFSFANTAWGASVSALTSPLSASVRLVPQLEHTGKITSVAFSPDGRQILSGSEDSTAKLRETVSSAEIHTFRGHQARINCVAFSPDGRRILTGSWDKTVRLWDAATGVELHKFIGHGFEVTGVAFSPDGSKVLSGSGDGTAKLWDGVSGALLHTFTTVDAVTSVAFSPDGRTIITGCLDRTAQLWDAVSGTRRSRPCHRYRHSAPDESAGSAGNRIGSATLATWLRDIDAGSMNLIIDACHSAAAVGNKEFKPGSMGSRGLGQLAYDKGMMVLAATQADDIEREFSYLRHGLLTYVLLREGLEARKADANHDGVIDLREWLNYGVEQVPVVYTAMKKNRFQPLPGWMAARAACSCPEMSEVPQQPTLFDFRKVRNEPILLK